MLSCMAFRQQTGIPRLAGRDVGSRSIRSTQIEPTEQSPKATNTRVDSFASRRSSTTEISTAIRIPSGLNATLYTSGYVECAYGGFGEGCRKRYDFVPDMTCRTARSPRTGTAPAFAI